MSAAAHDRRTRPWSARSKAGPGPRPNPPAPGGRTLAAKPWRSPGPGPRLRGPLPRRRRSDTAARGLFERQWGFPALGN